MAVHSPAVRNRHKTLRGTRRLFTGNHAALASFKRISTSTEPLAEHLMRCFPGVEAEVFPTLWSKAFGPENLHFIDYDQVSTSPAAVLRNLELFLGIPATEYPAPKQPVHVGKKLAKTASAEVLQVLAANLGSQVAAYSQLKLLNQTKASTIWSCPD